MRHRVAGKKLGRSSAHRKSLRRNLVTSLFYNGYVETTEAKAKAVQGYAEKLITLAKRGVAAAEEDPSREVHARRLVEGRMHRWVKDNDGYWVDVLAILFDEIAPRYMDRPGGYTRVYKLGYRKGDAAPMALLELV
ncbi:MAG: 50S ribosomal protein L17 [Chloroflexota bacterium]|nr:50S ribosomal protein L17 [Chloroflexota bacterium]